VQSQYHDNQGIRLTCIYDVLTDNAVFGRYKFYVVRVVSCNSSLLCMYRHYVLQCTVCALACKNLVDLHIIRPSYTELYFNYTLR